MSIEELFFFFSDFLAREEAVEYHHLVINDVVLLAGLLYFQEEVEKNGLPAFVFDEIQEDVDELLVYLLEEELVLGEDGADELYLAQVVVQVLGEDLQKAVQLNLVVLAPEAKVSQAGVAFLKHENQLQFEAFGELAVQDHLRCRDKCEKGGERCGNGAFRP